MRDDRERLRDILEAIDRIERYAGIGTAAFENNELDFCSAATGLKMGLAVPGADKRSLTHWSGDAGQFDLQLCTAPG